MRKKIKVWNKKKRIGLLVLCIIFICRVVIADLENKTFLWKVSAEDSFFEENTSEESTIEENGTKENGIEENVIEEGVTEEIKTEDLPCICEEVCKGYNFNKDCEMCAINYKDCTYEMPVVAIQIHQPDGWYRETAIITFTISDTANTGNFEIGSVQAKIGQNGNWNDVTEEKKLRISEDCVIYVVVQDQKGNTYEQNAAISCFDTTKPTLNAAVQGGLLKIQAYDRDSGIKAVSVNGYEFTDFTDSALTIHLQQFDAGYEYFLITAVDQVGNVSEVYQVKNPYYKNPADTNGENLAGQLPASAKATKPGSAVGTITEYTQTDANGMTVLQLANEQEEQEAIEKNGKEQGKEFYTIHTASEKVFYLVIEHGKEEKVYFLTEITEHDLLNVVSDKSETLPQNSAALVSAIPMENIVSQESYFLPEETKQANEYREETEMIETEETKMTETIEETKNIEDTGQKQENNIKEEKEEPKIGMIYLLFGILVVAFLIGIFYFKGRNKKKEDFIEEEEEDEEFGAYEDEEESEQDSEEDFFEEREEKEEQ